MPIEKMWLVYALLSAICASLVAVFGKMGLQSVDANVATAVRSVIMAVFLVTVIFVQGKVGIISEIISNKNAIVYIILSGVAGALSWLFYFLAIQIGEVSKVAPVDKLSVVISVILAVLLFNEKVSLLGGLGVLLISIGVILTALA